MITGQYVVSLTYFVVVWVLPGAMKVAGPYLSSPYRLAHTWSQYSGLRFQKQKEREQAAMHKHFPSLCVRVDVVSLAKASYMIKDI